MKMKSTLFVVCHLLCLFHFTCGDDFELIVLHTNDVHAHIEQFNKYGGTCEKEELAKNECFGGVARRQTVIDQFRKNNPNNTILLDGGDQFSGTLWFTVYKGKAAIRFMNHSKYDAMAIGNHEFDHGPANLADFMKQAAFAIVCSNMNVSAEPVWPNPPIYVPSTILERAGKKIGIIGYTTPDNTWLSTPGPNIKFSDPIESVRKEAQKLKGQGVEILIALGHAGYSVDKDIAKAVKELDLVVGGHTNTFLWNGPDPSVEKKEGPYPFVVERDDGTKCPVVQDFAYGKYLGNLKLTFSADGTLKKWEGNPIMLNASYPEDPKVLAMVQEMDDPIIAARTEPVARSLVFINGERSSCRVRSCSLGNMVADAVVKQQQQQPSNTQWATITLGIWNAGGIRSGSIDKTLQDNITREDLNTISPFGNTADIIDIKGKVLREAFEHGVGSVEDQKGRFPQVSGFQVIYDRKKPVGSRLVEARALCSKCRVPKYELIEDEKVYKVVMPSYLIQGGDGYSMLKDNEGVVKGETAIQFLDQYLRKNSPVAPVDELRIVDIDQLGYVPKDTCSSSASLVSATNSIVIQTLLILMIVKLL